MKPLIVLALALSSIGMVIAGNCSLFASASAALQEKESKTQPKETVLAKDSQSDKYGEVAFNHENHSTKKYSVDGQSVLTCVECHHTEQPATGLKPPLKTSERTKLTNEVAYHINCNLCHDKAIVARPALKGKAPGSNDCVPCHKVAG